jgi:hypothetical protein
MLSGEMTRGGVGDITGELGICVLWQHRFSCGNTVADAYSEGLGATTYHSTKFHFLL